MATIKLPGDVAEKYRLVNYTGGIEQVWGKFGKINVNTLTLAHADRLHQRGWRKLELKKTSTKEASTEKKAQTTDK